MRTVRPGVGQSSRRQAHSSLPLSNVAYICMGWGIPKLVWRATLCHLNHVMLYSSVAMFNIVLCLHVRALDVEVSLLTLAAP